MSSGKPRQITWPRLCPPFRSDDFRIHPHYNQFSSLPLKYFFSVNLSTDCIFVWLPLNTTLVISSTVRGPPPQQPKAITGGPPVKFGETIAKKFTRMGSDWQFRFSRPTQHVKYMSYLPPSTVLFFTLLYSGFLSHRRQSQRLLLSRSAVAMPA